MIYFVTARDLGVVKIGFAQKPQERFHTIQSHSPISLNLERVMVGSIEDEAELHSRFAAHRMRGEWFSLAPEIEALMASLPGHEWKSRGWHHAAKRAAQGAAA